MKNPSRALFVDRDGIFNELVPWGVGLCAPRHWGEVKLCPELTGISKVRDLGFVLVMVTNQPDVERNIIERRFVDDLNETHRKTHSLDGVYCCFFSSEDHPWKKPNPGMLQEAAKDFNLDLNSSYFLGDTERDVEAAQRAGCKSILWERDYNRDLKSDFRVKNLSELFVIVST